MQNNRPFYYDELQPHRPLQNRIRVSTPPYVGKVPPADPAEMFVPTPSRLHLETPGFARNVPVVDASEESGRQPPGTYIADTAYIGPIPLDTRITPDSELDYSRRTEIALCDGAVPRSRDSPPSQMDSPPLGDSPPQGNQDGTVLLVSIFRCGRPCRRIAGLFVSLTLGFYFTANVPDYLARPVGP